MGDFHDKLEAELEKRLLEWVKKPEQERGESQLFFWLGLRLNGHSKAETNNAYRQAVEARLAKRGHFTTQAPLPGDALGEGTRAAAMAGMKLADEAESEMVGFRAALETFARKQGFGKDWLAGAFGELQQIVHELGVSLFDQQKQHKEADIAQREAARAGKLWRTDQGDADLGRHLDIVKIEMRNAKPDELLDLLESEARSGCKAGVDLVQAEIRARGRTNDPREMALPTKAEVRLKAVQGEVTGFSDFESERRSLSAYDAMRQQFEKQITRAAQPEERQPERVDLVSGSGTLKPGYRMVDTPLHGRRAVKIA